MEPILRSCLILLLRQERTEYRISSLGMEAMHCWGHVLSETFCLARKNALLLAQLGGADLGGVIG